MEQKIKIGGTSTDPLHSTIQIAESGLSQLSGSFADDCDGVFKRNYDNAVVHLKNQQFEEAITLMENSLREAVKKYGEDALELAEHYFNLGSAILSKIENSRDVFAAAANAKKDNDESEDEDNEDEGFQNQENNEQNHDAAMNEEPKGQVSQSNEQKITAAANPNAMEEEPEDIQYAWEHLELARVFTEKKLNKFKDEGKIDEVSKVMKFLSIIHTKLGDANCYQENFKEALGDYENCLNLRKFNEDPCYSRGIAEAYYLIGQAHLYINTKEADDTAIMHFHKARIVLENILSKGLNLPSQKDPENKEEHKTMLRREFLNPNMFDQGEAKELKSLLIELYNKIEDTIQQRNERDIVDSEKEKVRLENEKNRELEKNFGKSAFEVMNLQGQTKQAPALPSTFNFSLFNTQNNGTTPANEENKNQAPTQEPPKFVKLGVFGNAAKKRMSAETPQNSAETKPSLAVIDQNVTKTDENGKTEKMIKVD